MRYDGRSTKRQPPKRRPSKNQPIEVQQEYWEARLAQEGLSMERGNNRHRLTFVGSSNDVERVETAIASTHDGCGGGRRTRTKPVDNE